MRVERCRLARFRQADRSPPRNKWAPQHRRISVLGRDCVVGPRTLAKLRFSPSNAHNAGRMGHRWLQDQTRPKLKRTPLLPHSTPHRLGVLAAGTQNRSSIAPKHEGAFAVGGTWATVKEERSKTSSLGASPNCQGAFASAWCLLKYSAGPSLQ
jgi:hypothetical protein